MRESILKRQMLFSPLVRQNKVLANDLLECGDDFGFRGVGGLAAAGFEMDGLEHCDEMTFGAMIQKSCRVC